MCWRTAMHLRRWPSCGRPPTRSSWSGSSGWPSYGPSGTLASTCRPTRSRRTKPCWPRALLAATARLDDLLERYPLRGIKGPVGTAQDMLDLLGGDEAALAELERRVASRLGFSSVLTSVGQVYPRSLDVDVLSCLVQLTAA